MSGMTSWEWWCEESSREGWSAILRLQLLIECYSSLNHTIYAGKDSLMIIGQQWVNHHSLAWDASFTKSSYIFSSVSKKGWSNSMSIWATSKAYCTQSGICFSWLKIPLRKVLRNSGKVSVCMACRSLFMRVKRKLMLCMERRWQKLSCFSIMWRQERVKWEQASHVHPSSMGVKSLAYALFLSLIYPLEVKAVPNRAVRVGKTQSNMSTPIATPKARSTGQPTPIRYLGLFGGRASQHCLTVLKKSFFASPPERPPIAYPEASTLISSFRQILRSSGSMPPWMMGKRVCLSGFLFPSMFLLIHLIVRSLASAIRGPMVVVFTTSSRAIMMSEPMSFWKPMESSGRMKISDWSQGDWNLTPASLISQSLLRETIWKPPESVRIFLFQLMN